jgi:hypothetical protein
MMTSIPARYSRCATPFRDLQSSEKDVC